METKIIQITPLTVPGNFSPKKRRKISGEGFLVFPLNCEVEKEKQISHFMTNILPGDTKTRKNSVVSLEIKGDIKLKFVLQVPYEDSVGLNINFDGKEINYDGVYNMMHTLNKTGKQTLKMTHVKSAFIVKFDKYIIKFYNTKSGKSSRAPQFLDIEIGKGNLRIRL